eukprot:symbB.v1.2.021305.t1/scaffold1793.1/size101111/2
MSVLVYYRVQSGPHVNEVFQAVLIAQESVANRGKKTENKLWKRVVPSETEFAWLPPDIAWAFCSDALRRRGDCRYLAFHEAHMGLQGRAFQANIFIVDMVFLGDTRSAEELAEEGALLQAIRPLVTNPDCHFLAVLTVLVQSILEGRTDCPISGVFGAGKTRAAAAMIAGLMVMDPTLKVMVVTKENAAAHAFAKHIESFQLPPSLEEKFGRLVGDHKLQGCVSCFMKALVNRWGYPLVASLSYKGCVKKPLAGTGMLVLLWLALAPERFPLQADTFSRAAGIAGKQKWSLILPSSARVSELTYVTIIGTRYPELDNLQNDVIQFGNYLQAEQCTRGGFLPIFWDAPYSYINASTDIGEVVDWIKSKFLVAKEGDLAVLHNRNKMVNAFATTEWVSGSGGAIISRSVTSCAGMTAYLVLLAQTRVGFLSGGRGKSFHQLTRQEQAAQKEEAYARATVALTRAQQICMNHYGPTGYAGLGRGSDYHGLFEIWPWRTAACQALGIPSCRVSEDTHLEQLQENKCLLTPRWIPVERKASAEKSGVDQDIVGREESGSDAESGWSGVSDNSSTDSECTILEASSVASRFDTAYEAFRDLADGLYTIDLTRYSRGVTSEDAAGVQLLNGQEKLQELVHLPRTWPLARLTIPLAGLSKQIDRLLEGYCFQILATNRDPEAHNGRVIQTATHLTWILAEYLADTIAWLLRSILDHASKILFDNDTQPLLTPKFWILPLYRELLNSARRIRPSPSSERARGCTGLAVWLVVPSKRAILSTEWSACLGPPQTHFGAHPWHQHDHDAAGASGAMEEPDSTEVVYKIRQWSLPGAAIVPVLNVSSRVFWLELDDKALLDSYTVLQEGILCDVFSQKCSAAWQGARGERLTVAIMLPGRQDADDWLNFMLSQKNLWPTFTTRGTLTEEVSEQVIRVRAVTPGSPVKKQSIEFIFGLSRWGLWCTYDQQAPATAA